MIHASQTAQSLPTLFGSSYLPEQHADSAGCWPIAANEPILIDLSGLMHSLRSALSLFQRDSVAKD